MKPSNQDAIDKYRNSCHTDKKAEDCHILAEFVRLNDRRKASKIYKVNCEENGYAKSCLEYGNHAFIGSKEEGLEPDPIEALKYFEKGCKLGSDENCLNSGLLLVSPKLHSSTLARDLPKGIGYLNKSCSMNNGNACFYLSGMYLSGADSSLSFNKNDEKNRKMTENFQIGKDMEKAFSLSVKACELKNIFACANLSLMYASGNGTEKNLEKAEYYKKITENLREEYRRQQVMSKFSHP